MIKVELSVREAMNMVSLGCGIDMYEKIVLAFEKALNVNNYCTMTITGGMTQDNRLHCIKAIRQYTGWGLKDAKDWSDYLVASWQNDQWYPAAFGTRQSMTLKTPEAAECLLRDLTTLGCEGCLS